MLKKKKRRFTYRAVFDDDPLVIDQKRLQGSDDSSEIRLIAVILVQPLGIQDIVHSDQTVFLGHDAGPIPPQLLHLATSAQKQAEVHADCSDVRAGLALDFEHAHVSLLVVVVEPAVVDRPHSQLTFDGRYQRWPLEQGAFQLL